jgi:hypothetical protein
MSFMGCLYSMIFTCQSFPGSGLLRFGGAPAGVHLLEQCVQQGFMLRVGGQVYSGGGRG